MHLTDLGISQIGALAEQLKDQQIDRLYVSPLRRTQQSAAIINKYHNTPIIVDVRLGDIATGYESQSDKLYYAALDSSNDRWNARFNGGESIEDVKLRVEAFIDDLKGKDYQTILVVSSRDVINAFYGLIKQLPNQEAWDHHIDQGSCTLLSL